MAAMWVFSGTAGAQTCPISGSLDATDSSQLGRLARNSGALACPSPTTKGFPGFAEQTNPHIYDIYHFTNPGASSGCFTFTLSWTGTNVFFAVAYADGTFNPTSLSPGYIGDVNGTATPLSMGITIAAGASIDVVVYAIGSGSSGVGGAYTLTADCALTMTNSAIAVALSSSGTVVSGQMVTFTAHLTGNGGGPTPTGTVTFKDGSTVLGSAVTVDGSGNATLGTSALTAGTHTISAVYSGDGTYPARTSVIPQTVNKANTTTATVMSSQNPQVFGNAVTFTTTVSANAPGSGTPTGNVNFLDGATVIGTGALSSGTASITTSALTAGTHNITAAYQGSSGFNTSTSAAAVVQTISLGDTTAAVASSQNPEVIGNAVTFTATVTAVSPAVGTPGGIVTFLDGTTTLGTGTLAAGQATFTTSALTGGMHTITATYSGDGNFNPSASPTLTQTITLLDSSTVVASSTNPQIVGEIVTFTATVSGAGMPTGTVSFLDGTAVLGMGMVVAGQASFSTTDLVIGMNSITAVYSGDATFAASISPVLPQSIVAASAMVSLSSTPSGSSTFGDPVRFDATVSAMFGGAPTGTVTFQDGTATLGTAPIASGVASFTTSALGAGMHTVTALYGGDATHDTASASTPYDVAARPTTTTLASSANPSVSGQTVTLTATVAAGGVTPSGSVTFKDGSTMLGTGPVNLDGSGVATLNIASLAVGTHALTASYGGTANFVASTSASLSQTVNKAGTTTALTSPSPGVVLGQPVTFTATVSAVAPGTGAPTGTVTFSDGGSVLGTGTVGGGGQATFTTSTLAVGAHSITAAYGGDDGFNASTSTAFSVTVGQLASSTTLASMPNPQSVGGSVTFTATVTGSGTPTGSVSFLDGTTMLGSATLASGQATFMTSALAAGDHSITATYAGDSNFVPSTSAPLTQTIAKAAASLTLAATPSPSVADQSVRFDATVTATLGGTPTGTVTFSDGGTMLGMATINAGVATFSTATLSVGMHTITAAYAGDGSHGAASGITMLTVNPISTTTALASSVNSTVFGQATTLTATVTASGTTPTGSVTFKDGTTTLGTGAVALDASGQATLSVSSLTVGSHSLTAEYAGPAKLAASVSPAVSQSVGQASTVTTIATSSSPVLPGAAVTFVALVTVTTPGAGTPSGSVTFMDGATVLGTVALPSSDFVTFTTSSLADGTHTITASYAGDARFKASVSTALSQVVSGGAVVAALGAAPSAPVYGESLTFMSTLTAMAGGTPTGTVTFTEGTTTVGTGTLDANGVARLTTHLLPAGSHTMTVTYGGDSLHAAGSTASTTLSISKRSTATVLDAAPNPSAAEAAVTLTATITMSATPPAGGSDLVALDGTVTFKDGTTTVGTATVATGGTATLTLSTLTMGSHSLTATYEGADNYATSTSAAVTQQVTAAPPPDGGSDGAGTDGGADGALDAGDAAAGGGGSGGQADSGAGGTGGGAGHDAGGTSDGATDAPHGRSAGGGCGCHVADPSPSGIALLGLAALAALFTLRGRRRR
jgi:MYXO-CTERM domain-containing protein